MRVVDMGEKELHMMLQAAREMGRGDDTDIVHVNEAEKKILKEAGGEGSINPKTGLREYKYGGNVSEGGKTQGSKDAGGQGPKGNGGASGERGTLGQQQDARNQTAAQKAGNVAPGVKADDRNRSLMDNSPTDIARSFTNAAKAQKDFAGEDDTFLDKVGNFIAGMFGWSEADPMSSSMESFKDFNTAEDQIDPIAAALGLASAAFPPAGVLSMGYKIAKTAGVNPPQISLRGSPSMENAERMVNTASGSAAGKAMAASRGGNQGRDTVRQNDKYPFSNTAGNGGRNKPTENKVTKPGTTPAPVEPPKSPADVLMERYKLPGINAPFSLTPYQIDRTRHNELVADALQGRGGM